MLTQTLLVLHVAVLGYWLGAEFVINSTFRFVCRARAMPFGERDRLMDHVMDADQHVRYALALQVGLGTLLMLRLGHAPGGASGQILAAMLTVSWLALIELAHRARSRPSGRRLARVDRAVRYALIVVVGVLVSSVALGRSGLAPWLAAKLAAFAGVIGCGLAIRWLLLRFYRHWQRLSREGSTDQIEGSIRSVYRRATAVLGLLWALIAVIVALSIVRPVF